MVNELRNAIRYMMTDGNTHGQMIKLMCNAVAHFFLYNIYCHEYDWM